MNIDKKKLAIQLLALTGLTVSIKLAFIYHSANFDPYALSSFCSINKFVDCDGVAKSTYSQFLGIPLAYWGIFLYIIMLFLTFVDKLKGIKFLKFLEVFKNPNAYISTLGTISFVCSMGLAGISLYLIKKICILCVATYFLDLIIATIAADGLFRNILKNFKTTVLDFIAGAKTYTKTFIVLMLLTTSFLTYTGVTLKFVPHVKRAKNLVKYRKLKTNPYKVNGNVLGNPNGEIVINLYSDYICPMCYIHNIMLHQAVKEFSNIKVVHYNYPFDKKCNIFIESSMHPGACYMSRAAIAAKKQNNYWGMSSLLYEKQPKNQKEMYAIAEELGFNKYQFGTDFLSEETSKELLSEIISAQKLEIDATPTMVINGEKIVGLMPYYELKKVLKKYGAK